MNTSQTSGATGNKPPFRPFRDASPSLTRKGWHVVPELDHGAVPKGFTGYDRGLPTDVEIEAWREQYPDNNVALVLPHDVIVIDVDYKVAEDGSVKDGGPQAIELLATLPPTFTSGHGDPHSVYRHYFYRVPEHVTKDEVASLGGGLGVGIDLLKWNHRWSRIAPSVHKSGERYYWLNDRQGTGRCTAPEPTDLAQLSTEQWEALKALAGTTSQHYRAADVDTQGWLDTTGTGEPDADVERAYAEHWGAPSPGEAAGGAGVARHGSHHDAALVTVQRVAHLAEEGHPGARAVLKRLRNEFVAYAEGEGRDGTAEFERMLVSGVGKAFAKTEAGDREPDYPKVTVLEGVEPLHRRHEARMKALPGSGTVDADTLDQRFPLLDLDALLDPARPPRPWLLDGVVPEGDHVSIVAPGGVGKSLLVLSLAIEAVRGSAIFIGQRLTFGRTNRVLYVDMENSEEDWAERLRSLGVSREEARQLAEERRFLPLSLPPLGGLDTEAGARDLVALIEHHGLTRGDLVVLDSTQRITAGAENDADTVRNLYNLTSAELKRRGLTVIRTDNTGKDEDRGARGSSGKRDDVAYSWVMKSKGPNRFALSNDKARGAGVADTVIFERVAVDGVLRHQPAVATVKVLDAKSLDFKAAVRTVLTTVARTASAENNSRRLTQNDLLAAVKDEGAGVRKTLGIELLGQMVAKGDLRATGGEDVTNAKTGRASKTAKFYEWAGSVDDLDTVEEDDGDAY